VNIFFQYVAMLKELSPQQRIFEEQKTMADAAFKFKQKTFASRFTRETSSFMQKPSPREWLLRGGSQVREFNPDLITQALDQVRPDNLLLLIISRDFPGDWNQEEKWYGTQYKHEEIPDDFIADLWEAARTSASDRIPELHLPHKNIFIPDNLEVALEVEKKEVAEPALAPRHLRNDGSASTWWKKDDTFWVPQANVFVSLETPVLGLGAKSSVLGQLLMMLVRDALTEYSYDAKLAGLKYSLGLEMRRLRLDVCGYNHKLIVFLDKVMATLKNLDTKQDRFRLIKERLTREYNNLQLQFPYEQVGYYMSWLTGESDHIVDLKAAELPAITLAEASDFRDVVWKSMHIEVYVHGNMHRNEALEATNMVESILNAGVLPPEQRSSSRSFALPESSNYVYNKTLQDPDNVNHCVETFFHVGERGDRAVRARTLLIAQMLHEPAFDQLRTKEQLGYAVFTDVRAPLTTTGIRFIIQSERTPRYLDTRIEAFLASYGEILANMSVSEFEGHKRSSIVKCLEKPKNLDQESSQHWEQISDGFYDFDQGNVQRHDIPCRTSADEIIAAQLDAAQIEKLSKDDMDKFFKKHLDPRSTKRARLSVHLHARASELDKNMIDLFQRLKLNDIPQEKRQSVDVLESYLQEQNLPENKISEVMQKSKDAGLKSDNSDATLCDAVLSAVEITDVNEFKAGLTAVSGGRPSYPFSNFEDSETYTGSSVLSQAK
jgi:insulysin